MGIWYQCFEARGSIMYVWREDVTTKLVQHFHHDSFYQHWSMLWPNIEYVFKPQMEKKKAQYETGHFLFHLCICSGHEDSRLLIGILHHCVVQEVGQ